jgi:hydrogenase/urease accessory protein HupE
MKRSKWIVTAAALSLAPAAALAHPGHGALTGLMHGFEPLHALPVLALIACGVWLARRARKAKS